MAGVLPTEMLVVLIDHPGIESERVTKEHAMPTRIFEFERAVVRDDRERDEIAKTGNGVDRVEGLRRVSSSQENGRRQLNPEGVGEPREEFFEIWMGPAEAGDSPVGRGGEDREFAVDRFVDIDVRQDENGLPLDHDPSM